MDDTTGVMAEDRDPASDASADPGLVLAYAPNWREVPRAFCLTKRTHTIGREPPPGGFALKVEAVSRLHLRVDREQGAVRIKDLGSRNGTFLNGAAVTEAELAPGDVVRVGDAFFVFVARDAREHASFALDGKPSSQASLDGLVGGLSMARVAREVRAVASGVGAVLVRGETGTGKELVARAVHELSARPGAFVAVNSAALPATLVESELFGHVRGAFTGADADKVGLFRAADRGTLFLDEIGDLPLDAQAKLLRVMETREVRSLGARSTVVVDVRVVSATHKDLAAMVAAGTFRADLYARLFAHELALPPLRDRKEDLYALLRVALARAGSPTLEIGPPVMARVLEHDWPFNMRELQSVAYRAAARALKGALSSQEFPEPARVPRPSNRGGVERMGGGLKSKRPAPSSEELAALMREHRGNVSAVARALERDAALIYRWLKQHALDPAAFR
ncbi:MAG: sigma 54-interacting transcriptional regulator [Polyangiaceae bacterium]